MAQVIPNSYSSDDGCQAARTDAWHDFTHNGIFNDAHTQGYVSKSIPFPTNCSRSASEDAFLDKMILKPGAESGRNKSDVEYIM
jgi:hypothetical protein